MQGAPYPGSVSSTPPSGPRAGELSPADRRAGRLVAAGGVLFLLGLLALGIVLALWARQGSAPGALSALALLCPVGFAVAFAGLVVQARAARTPRD